MIEVLKRTKLIILFVVFSAVLWANETPFRISSFEEAEKISKKENKPLLVDFYATWCGPCKWMDETTFSDQEIKKLLTEDYISIKVNIDDFDGYELKSKYEVRYLPTIIIFKNGRVIERLEETVGVSKMIALLTQHKSTSTNTAKKAAPNTNPKLKTDIETYSDNLTVEEINSNFNSLNHIYKLQLGVFTKKESANKLVNDLGPKLLDQPQIIQDYKNNSIVYKVVLGEFNTMGEAEALRNQLITEHKMEGYIVKM
jgi:thiol-disulfide isomerase/thioredoxin